MTGVQTCALPISSRKAIKITESVISGVVALRIPAKIEVTCVSASAKSTPGTELSKSEITQRCNHTFTSFGKVKRWPITRTIKVMAPSAHLIKATPNGVKNSNPNLMKMNEHPQTTPSAQ